MMIQNLLYMTLALALSQITKAATTTTTTTTSSPLTTITFRTIPLPDVLFTEDLLWEKPARSRIECSAMCRGDARCVVVTFQPGGVTGEGPPRQPGRCRSHLNPQSNAKRKEAASGARSLVLVAEDWWIPKSCSSNADCTESMAACISGQCLCDGGYFFDYTQNACVRECWWGLGKVVLKYPGKDLDGHDIGNELANNDPAGVCGAICVADPNCVTFSYNREWDRCFFKNVTSRDFPEAWLNRPPVDFFQRTCAKLGG
ncbi:hypothetical protein ACOMHN_047894 [Nucella lapillus]